ncbi:nucleotide sugar dehydrogenase [Sphingomonas sp.]|uniref:nucleotide sugar dehydrogenase n=1 Tax=Sphingomonas sp. TaxID=28214 RepID=UPI003B3A07A3
MNSGPNSDGRIVVVGLGYVGLPLAVALARSFSVLGLDIDDRRIAELRSGRDRTGEVAPDALAASALAYASDPAEAAGADVYIVTVPTPVDADNRPDLSALIAASRTVGRLLVAARRPIIVYESTVYPGVTEDVCAPILAEESGLVAGRDFFLGYSPERINPGDRTHTIERITKVVAGQTPDVTDRLADLYSSVTQGGVFRAASIRVAEAAKVIENAQRDINIAFMNEVTQIFAQLDISIWDVLDAARTKWNFLPFQPGLVGGHCIGVDPYYLSFRAQQLGHQPEVILAGRAINDGMGAWVADRLHAALDGRIGRILVLGLTFKENVPDLRNSRVIGLIRRLEVLGHEVRCHDPRADPVEAKEHYGIALLPSLDAARHDLIIAAVAHEDYQHLAAAQIEAMVAEQGMVADLKGLWRDVTLRPEIGRWSL